MQVAFGSNPTSPIPGPGNPAAAGPTGPATGNPLAALGASPLSATQGTDQVRFGSDSQKPEANAKETPAPQNDDFQQKLRNGAKEAGKAIFNKNGLIDDTGWIGVVSLALIMIPGHQIISVPAIYGIGATIRAGLGFIQGFQNEKYTQGSFFKSMYHKFRDRNATPEVDASKTEKADAAATKATKPEGTNGTTTPRPSAEE